MKLRFDTSQGRQTGYGLLRAKLEDQTDSAYLARSLSKDAKILLGLRAYPNKS